MRGRSTEGFTLVELLVSLMAGALLVAILVALLADIKVAWRRSGEVDIGASSALAARLDTLLGGILAAEPGSGEVVFEGSAQRLVALVPAPQALASVGLVRLTLEARHSANGTALVAQLAPEDADAAMPEPFREPQVLASVSDIHFSYLADDGSAPADSWPASARPPAAIRIELAGRNPQVIVARPIANVDGRCLFDPISLNCRLQTSVKETKLAP